MKFLRKVLFFSLMLLALCLCVSAQAKTFSIPFGMELVAMGKGDVFTCTPKSIGVTSVEWNFAQAGDAIRVSEHMNGSITVVAEKNGMATILGTVKTAYDSSGFQNGDIIRCSIHVTSPKLLPKSINVDETNIFLDPVFKTSYTPKYTILPKKSQYQTPYFYLEYYPYNIFDIDHKTGTITLKSQSSVVDGRKWAECVLVLPNGLSKKMTVLLNDISQIDIIPEGSTTIKRKASRTISAKVNGGLSDASVVWTANKPNLISITQIDPQTISVTGVKKGKVVLTASIGGVKDSITLKIK